MNSLLRKLRALFFGSAIDREMSEEMRTHIELETDDLVRTKGLSREEARRQAMIAFGGTVRYQESHRDVRGTRWFDDSLRDVRYAIRVLLRSPAYTVAAALILALAIGATTAVFSGVNALMLRALPYPHDEQLVRIYEQVSADHRWSLSVVDYRAIEAQSQTIQSIGGFWINTSPVSAGDDPKNMTIAVTTSGLFKVLDIHPAYGRAIEPRDEVVGAPLVAVVTHGFAQDHLGGDAAAVGRTIMIDGKAETVVGVLPAGVTHLAGVHVPVWGALQLETPKRRGPFGMLVYARLKDGVTLDAARKDLAGVSERIFPIWAAGYQDNSSKLTPVPLRTVMLRDAPKTLALFGAAALMVLLIAVANVASLTLVRATARAPELSLRSVLGATRARLVRLVVVESVVLALAGAAGGIVLGALGLDLLVRIGPDVPRLNEAHLDPQAVAFAVAVALVAGVIIGAYPIVMLLKGDSAALGGGARAIGGGRRTHAARGAFVVAEFALALPLLAGTGMLLSGFIALSRIEPGFDADRIATMRVALPVGAYPNDSARQRFWARALPALEELPGIASAGFSSARPPDAADGINMDNFDLVDAPVPAGVSQPVAPEVIASHGYFETFELPVIEGRDFGPADSAGGAEVMIVSHAWAQHYFPGRSAVGRQLIVGGCVKCPHTTIVGVVGDLPYLGLGETRDAMYDPAAQGTDRVMNLFVRAKPGANTQSVVMSARAALHALDPAIALDDQMVMRDAVYGSVAEPRHLVELLGGFSGAAVVLAAVGIFGLLSYTVSARRKEIGVRMALGAQRAEVVREIVARGMRYAVLGAGIGIVVAVAGERVVGKVIGGSVGSGVVSLSVMTVVLLGVAAVAAWIPARRAAGVDPVMALRD
jgi:predicted permease